MRDKSGRFVPGHSGNPGGRPSGGETLTDVLRRKVDKDSISDKLIEMAMEKGDIAALKYIYDRMDGKPVETINQTVREIPEFVRFDDADYPEDREADQE